MSGDIEIKAVDGKIIVTGCDGKPVTVSSIDGKLVYNAPGRSLTEIPVSGGVYVVKASDKVCKLIVRD